MHEMPYFVLQELPSSPTDQTSVSTNSAACAVSSASGVLAVIASCMM